MDGTAGARLGTGRARATERSLVLFGLGSTSALFGTVLLVVSEPLTNAVRHIQQSPDAEITVHMLTVTVADLDTRPITPTDAARTSGQGLHMVADLARTFSGDVRIEPAPDGRGKTVVVRFILPEGTP